MKPLTIEEIRAMAWKIPALRPIADSVRLYLLVKMVESYHGIKQEEQVQHD